MTRDRKQVFLIIGLTKESAHWDDVFVEHLSKTLGLENDDIIAVDLPGAGAFNKELSPISVNGIVKKTRERYLDAMYPDAERLVIAISLGGMIAMEWAACYPEDFHKMVILNSSFRNLSPLKERLQPDALREFTHIFRSRTLEERERKVIELCCNDARNHDRVLQKWIKIAKERPMSKRNMVIQTLAAARHRLTKKPDIPIFVVAAQHDRLAHYSCSEKLSEHLGADWHLFEDESIGHAIHTDAPQQLVERIARWLARLSIQSARL